MSSPSEKEKFLRALQSATTARIGIGQRGGRYPTAALLKFREDLAAAKDAVHHDVDEKQVQELGLLSLRSRVRDRQQYLMDTQLGRRLDEASVAALQTVIPAPDVQIVTSDGLSGEAFQDNVPDMLPLLDERLRAAGLKLGTPLFVRWARVGVLDHIGEIVRPKAALILLGERPGMGISNSLSGYFGYLPGPGRLEADRNVLCNIHPRGVPAAEAALLLADALIHVLKIKKSGMSVHFDFT